MRRQITRARLCMGTVWVMGWLFATTALPGNPTGTMATLSAEWSRVQLRADKTERATWWRNLTTRRLSEFLAAAVDVSRGDRRGWTPLHSAARFNPNPDIGAMLIHAGATVTARDRAGDTPLHWAAAENPVPAVLDVLIRAGADVNKQDRFGWTPLHCAADRNPNPDVIEGLLAAGADTTKRAYFLLFSPRFLLKHNERMNPRDRKRALGMLAQAAAAADR